MLEINNLSVEFKDVTAVKNVSLSVARGEILGILGESGSGKSTIAHSILRLIYPPGKIVAGEIIFNGQDLMKLSEDEMIKIRGAKISMIFQDPFSSLNPVFTVGEQIAEVIRLPQGLNRREAYDKAVQMLELVKIKDPAARIKDYPHQFSGGMRQRVMIAMALACEPELLLADEPTTALDAAIQDEILNLLRELKDKFNLSIIYITHNFSIIKSLCSRVVVLNKGKLVEEGGVEDILQNPQEPYTQNLINCVKILNNYCPT
ncbi:ABC transporter ATP-binding protein [Candidatus Saganbacteria bacterium CG08_land_8_20_14_0_20_45_16]|uniref:ABC transporter ATP-binding protein n=1 Tax=Candidatus Saganbacteria bacterium CG08_land_8_20_14_0_20_45_16 TaxID=2014293 RepID=A0A2H0Y194_UNCSA|nr:MAG: ABC transporter ATP-binding protein [Candidatus Saganbacteria bacterium CG08_land_8_20_14_0_20_45_16]